MIHYIKNEYLTVGVKEYGCELASIKSNKNGREYLWQGDESIWYGQAPILFPIVGRLFDDKYSLNGTEYTLAKHGFARKTEWKPLEKEAEKMSFILSESEATLKSFPYKFDLIVTYTLNENRLTVSHDVINKNDSVMYFSLGAHPAFNCALGDILRFDEKETLSTEKIDLEKSLRLPETFPVLNDETDIVITKDIFNEDALILHGIKSENVTLISDKRPETVKFNLGKAPYLGIWAKPGAPYVCIEPWCGVNDSQKKKADFSLKDGINALAPKAEFNFTWSAEFSH